MKKIFKKNQIVITGLAIMIAVAGYLKFANTNEVSDANAETTQESEIPELSEAEISETEVGDAVLVNSGSLTFVSQAKLNREQVRAENKELLFQIVNNTNLTDAEKENAVASLLELTDISEKESAAEVLLAANGFDNSVVSITDGLVDVIINSESITDAQRAQIEDAVKNKTGITASNITITLSKAE